MVLPMIGLFNHSEKVEVTTNTYVFWETSQNTLLMSFKSTLANIARRNIHVFFVLDYTSYQLDNKSSIMPLELKK